VPEDLVGTFDIVNVRLIVFVIEEDPAPVLRNLMKLLSEYRHYYRAPYTTMSVVADAFISYI